MLPQNTLDIGPTHTASILVLITVGSLLTSDYLAVWKASGRIQLVGFWSRQDRGSYFLIQITTVGGLFLAVVAPQKAPGLRVPGPVWICLAVGLPLAYLGIALRIRSVLTLGRSFQRVVTVTRDQAVVTTGPYRFVRHPSYTGLLMALLGAGIMLCNWGSIAALGILPAIGILRRIAVEERALRQTLVQEYSSYADKRSRLVPGLW